MSKGVSSIVILLFVFVLFFFSIINSGPKKTNRLLFKIHQYTIALQKIKKTSYAKIEYGIGMDI